MTTKCAYKQLAILDTETDGVTKDARVLEVACILYDIASATPIESFSSLIYATENAAEAVNRIPVYALLKAPRAARVWGAIASMTHSAQLIAAHNASFDAQFVPSESSMDPAYGCRWLCTMDDLAWPVATKTGGSLVNLALQHGLGVSHAHRAMTDCDLISRLLTRVAELGTDLDAFIAHGLRPKAKFAACVSYSENQLAKDAGFKWDPAEKVWWRTMAVADALDLNFKTRMLES